VLRAAHANVSRLLVDSKYIRNPQYLSGFWTRPTLALIRLCEVPCVQFLAPCFLLIFYFNRDRFINAKQSKGKAKVHS
jgi:hypothetical protein